MIGKTLRRIRLPLLPVYPILFGIFPVLFLWNTNRAQQQAYVVIPSLLATLAGVAGVFFLAYALTRNLHRAALLTSVMSLYVLSFGHIANLLPAEPPNLEQIFLPVSALLIAALLARIAVRGWGNPDLTRALNLVSAGLVVFQLASAAPYYLTVAKANRVASATKTQASIIPVTGGYLKRDVYFIMLDNYGRQDILLRGANYDNSAMVDALKERGFVFPSCAQSNYFHTSPVMAAILNMQYMDTLGIKEISYTRRDRYGEMAPYIQNSVVLRKFREYGYHTVTFRGFMGLLDIQNADTYVSFEKDMAFNERLETQNFSDLYRQTTLFGHIETLFNLKIEEAMLADDRLVTSADLLEPKFHQVYQQNLYAFEALKQLPRQIKSPKFVYAHIYSAHWPFMIQPDGSLRLPFTQKITDPGYVAAVRYTNNQLIDAIDAILENSKTRPIIIIQGDHSNEFDRRVEWSGKDRLKILSAYYLPDGGEELLYDKISPVNNFRLIFQHYFNEDIELLPDEYYYLDPNTKQVKEAPPTCMSETGR